MVNYIVVLATTALILGMARTAAAGPLDYCDKQACLAHGRIISADPIPKNGIVTFACDPYYKMVGRRTLTCLGGRFDGAQPVCVRNHCREPVQVIPFGRRVTSPQRTLPGGLAVYACNPGYRATGPMTTKCQPALYWQPITSRCVAI